MNNEDDNKPKGTSISPLDFSEDFLMIYMPPYKLFSFFVLFSSVHVGTINRMVATF